MPVMFCCEMFPPRYPASSPAKCPRTRPPLTPPSWPPTWKWLVSSREILLLSVSYLIGFLRTSRTAHPATHHHWHSFALPPGRRGERQLLLGLLQAGCQSHLVDQRHPGAAQLSASLRCSATPGRAPGVSRAGDQLRGDGSSLHQESLEGALGSSESRDFGF